MVFTRHNWLTKPIANQKNIPEKETDTIKPETDLQKLYFNVKSIPSYSSKITDFLRKNYVSSVHKRITKKRFPRREIIVRNPYSIFQADLLEFTEKFRHHNNGYKYILVVIDSFSRKLWVKPIKNKNASSTADAFSVIFKTLPKYPHTIQVDKGKEFWNKDVEHVFKKHGIMAFSTNSIIKASMAERVIQTIKNRLEKYMTKHKTKRWINYIDQLVENYNNLPHRSIGMSPNHVTNKNRGQVFKKLHPRINLHITPRLSKGDQVRVLKSKLFFEKSSTKNWSDELYTIISVNERSAVEWYRLIDKNKKLVPGIFYYYQLNLVKHANSFRDQEN